MNRPARCTASSLTSNLECNGGDGRRGRWQAATGNDVMDSFKSFDELHLKRTLRADSGCNLQELPREPVIDTHLHSPDAIIQEEARSQLTLERSLFYSTGAKYLKQFMRQYSYPFELSSNDWRTFIWFLQSKPILTKTVSQYILQARRVLDFFNIPHLLHPGKLTKITFKRTRRTTPRREYCALEWNNVRKICNVSRTFSHNW